MRFTKIPLIATLMAVALSLLIVLPGLGQARDITDGRLNNVNITVGVFANIADAELPKLSDTPATDGSGRRPPLAPEPTPPAIGGVHDSSDTAYLADGVVQSPRETLFRNTLYVSNNVGAYNTVLVDVAHDPVLSTADGGTLTCDPDDTGTTNVDEDAVARVTATVRNNRSSQSITMQLVGVAGGANSQAYFKVVEQGDTGTVVAEDGTPVQVNNQDVTRAFTQHGGPTWCDDSTLTRHIDDDDNPATPANDDDGTPGTTDTPVQVQTQATSAGYLPVNHPEDLAPFARQEIATIFARHGDRLTVTVPGASGQIELVVDGDGPDFTAVTPEDNAVTRSSRLNFSFEVRDDDSGLRHDGESVISTDGDFTEINPDGDHALHSEPLSVNPQASTFTNGSAADINVNVTRNAMDGTTTPPDTSDISASGTWSMAGNRAGVAYVFSASGAGYAENPYLYQLRARDRAGNWASTDAVADEDDNEADEPYVFRVDNTDPALSAARTGISYDTAKNVEKVDRSYIALEFTEDALGEVDTDNITVVGHTIVGVIHPNKAPVINRGATKVSAAPSGSAPRAPGSAPSPVVTDPSGRDPVVATPSGWDGTFLGSTDENPADPNPNVKPTTCADDPPTPSADDCAAWDAWLAYEGYVSKKRSYDARKLAYDTYNQYARENPGRDIEDGWITEPRARVYLELAEELESDETPAVVVVGGAVFDLAGNTNDARTIEKAMDWIAPGLTVTVTGTANDRPVANADGAFNIDVRSDEDLLRRPRVFFVEIEERDADGSSIDNPATYDGEYTYRITNKASGGPYVDTASNLALQEDENHWARSYKVSSIESSFDGLVGVIVVGYDDDENIGATAGWTAHPHRRNVDSDVTPASGNKLDLAKLNTAGLLAEIDKLFNNGNEDGAGNDIESKIGTVTPRSDDDGTETESANPFVKLEFAYEKGEYEAGTFTDSHDRVDVTEITLGGDDAKANLNRVSETSFSLITRDLAVGTYTVEYTAVDDAGNEFEGEFDFDVNERQPYEISVQPGWNLVSLPATPLDPAIGAVLADNQYISPVLGYQEGDWLTAIQEEDGTWRGRLTEITGGYGYWVHARTFESIETMLAEVDPAATLPTVPVTAGWNLLGVLDILQNNAGDPPGEKDPATGDFAADNYEADNYFSSIGWKVAYTYDTRQSLWVKTVPDDDDDRAGSGPNPGGEIVNGNGYWVWSPTPTTLVP